MSALSCDYFTSAMHHGKSVVSALVEVSIDLLFDINLEPGKRNYCFGKSLGKLKSRNTA